MKVREAIGALLELAWRAALDQDGQARPNGEVADLIDLSGRPEGPRLLVRCERPIPAPSSPSPTLAATASRPSSPTARALSPSWGAASGPRPRRGSDRRRQGHPPRQAPLQRLCDEHRLARAGSHSPRLARLGQGAGAQRRAGSLPPEAPPPPPPSRRGSARILRTPRPASSGRPAGPGRRSSSLPSRNSERCPRRPAEPARRPSSKSSFAPGALRSLPSGLAPRRLSHPDRAALRLFGFIP
jgi:hypothetical protein